MKIIVVGAGIWGSWTAYLLNKAEFEVTLIDMHGPGNERSGSGAYSRIMRRAYGGDMLYHRMANESWEYWEQLFENKEDLFCKSGLLWLFSHSDDSYLRNSIQPNKKKIRFLPIGDAAQLYPQICFDDILTVYLEEEAGLFNAKNCCKYLVNEFVSNRGNYIRGRVIVDEKNISKTEFIRLDGKSISSNVYVFACGPWSRNYFPKTLTEITYVSGQEVYYFDIGGTEKSKYEFPDLPPWLDLTPQTPMFYGIPPVYGSGYKVSYDGRTVSYDPEQTKVELTPDILQNTMNYLSQRLPGTEYNELLEWKMCPYDNSLDGHFILDQHPENSNVILLAGSSGHGFKLAPSVGKQVVDYILDRIPFPSRFAISRLKAVKNKATQFLR